MSKLPDFPSVWEAGNPADPVATARALIDCEKEGKMITSWMCRSIMFLLIQFAKERGG